MVDAEFARRRLVLAPADPPAAPPINWTFVSLIAAAVLQLCGAVWFGSNINTRVGELEKQSAALVTVPATLAVLSDRSQAQGDQLTHLVRQQDAASERRSHRSEP